MVSNVAYSADVRVVAAWAAGPLEARVQFADPIADRAIFKKLVGTRIVFGDDVKAGDVYVERKADDPPLGENRGSLRIAAVKFSDDGKTLILATDPHSRDTKYAFKLPTEPPVNVSYSLRGVELTWDRGGENPKVEWSGWMDSMSPSTGIKLPTGAGRLTMKTLLTVPKRKVGITVETPGAVEVSLGNESAKGEKKVTVSADAEFDQMDLVITVALDGKPDVPITVRDANGKSLDPAKQTLAWAPPLPPTSPAVPVAPELIAGGDRAKGEMVFKSEAAKCVNCHKVRGVGGEVGPDLSNLVHRDRAWVYRNLTEPSATIHPDYVPYTVLIKDGRVLSGIVRAEGADKIKVLDTEAKATVVEKSDIEELKPSTTSIMPVGLTGAIGEASVRDLIAFLTTK